MKKILSIDDEPLILACLKEALQNEGYEVEVTSDPRDGLERLKNDPTVDLALLDVKMPGLSGFDIYMEYRRVRRIPAIFVTAYPASFTTESDQVVQMWEKEFADGTTDIVYKPFDLDVLFEKVEGLIGKANEPKAIRDA